MISFNYYQRLSLGLSDIVTVKCNYSIRCTVVSRRIRSRDMSTAAVSSSGLRGRKNLCFSCTGLTTGKAQGVSELPSESWLPCLGLKFDKYIVRFCRWYSCGER
jgi:hypothetical protein